MRRFLLIGIMVLLMTAFAQAMTCNYDSEPYIQKDIDWSCEVAPESQCYGAVFDNESNLVSVSPVAEDIGLVGRIDYFSSQGTLVNIKFRTDDLYESVPYNFSVFCSSNITLDSFSAIVVPVYKELRAMPYQGIWVKDNLPYLFGLIAILILAIPIIILAKR